MSHTGSLFVRTLLKDDKGELTTRLMRHDDPATAQRADLLPPVPPLPQLPSNGDTTEQFMNLIFGPNASDLERDFVERLKDNDAATIPLAVKLLTTGCSEARSRVRHVVERSIQTISEDHSESHPDGWKERYTRAWSPHIKNSMSIAWNTNNIAAEINSQTNPIDLQARVSKYHDLLNHENPDIDLSARDYYWRGLAVFSAINVMVMGTKWRDLPGFVAWAGKHTDPKRIVNLAVERDTLDSELLSTIMSEQDHNGTALKQGAL